MTAAQHNLVIEQHATFRREIRWNDAAGNPINLTGYRIRMQARQEHSSSTVLLDFDTAALGPGMTIGPLNSTGVISIALSPTATAALSFQNARYDLIAIAPGGETHRLIEGRMSVVPAVTR
ncbi:hypothetical protein C6N75_09930 [Streptomyces solincola]|uniref:Uncharacterized protein n=1 Tax=Streptomyces solincola TaxID=2100817 RepID=A0A2S9PYA8_9ACTN|nr:hypothetical protein [Streptomyces solincola]PRH79392.1 hypothetical protein C6N75_09930 [Streptomyces solincola]